MSIVTIFPNGRPIAKISIIALTKMDLGTFGREIWMELLTNQ